MGNMLDCVIVASEFKLQLHSYLHFWTNAPWEKYELLYLLSYGLDRTFTVLLWH